MEKEIVVVQESAIDSIIKDIFTFGSIALLLHLNFKYFGNHASVAILLVILAIIFAYGWSVRERCTFRTKDEAIKHLENL